MIVFFCGNDLATGVLVNYIDGEFWFYIHTFVKIECLQLVTDLFCEISFHTFIADDEELEDIEFPQTVPGKTFFSELQASVSVSPNNLVLNLAVAKVTLCSLN